MGMLTMLYFFLPCRDWLIGVCVCVCVCVFADYVFGERKFGGNAQSFSSGRCCHHTSFLWDYDAHRMDLLSNPAKQPEYRKVRKRALRAMYADVSSTQLDRHKDNTKGRERVNATRNTRIYVLTHAFSSLP